MVRRLRLALEFGLSSQIIIYTRTYLMHDKPLAYCYNTHPGPSHLRLSYPLQKDTHHYPQCWDSAVDTLLRSYGPGTNHIPPQPEHASSRHTSSSGDFDFASASVTSSLPLDARVQHRDFDSRVQRRISFSLFCPLLSFLSCFLSTIHILDHKSYTDQFIKSHTICSFSPPPS